LARSVAHNPHNRDVAGSPLADRVNGFLLGHCLALAALAPGLVGAAERGDAVVALLRELGLDVLAPCTGLAALLPALVSRAPVLADFARLGGLLTSYSLQPAADTAPGRLADVARLCGRYDLPPLDPRRLAVAPNARALDAVTAPALGYLRACVIDLPAEHDTAFVVLPPGAAFVDAFLAFVRPTLANCGYRAHRAWSGIDVEAHAQLQLACVARAGLIWADVTGLDARVAHLVGAAHALDAPCVLVAREDPARPAPASLGCDPIVRYDPRDADWPTGAVLLMAACLSAIRLAAQRGDRLRLSPDSIAGVFDDVSHALGRVLVPEDDETRVWRAWARVGAGLPAEAAADFDAILGPDPLTPPIGEWRPIAAYLRAVLREAQGDLAGALSDCDLALALGFTDPEVVERRHTLAARVRS
jgi:hypothetical protein